MVLLLASARQRLSPRAPFAPRTFRPARKKSDGMPLQCDAWPWFAYQQRQLGTPRASSRSRTVTQSCRKTCFGELIRIAITRIDLEPIVANSLIQSSLEIGISHIDEMMTS